MEQTPLILVVDDEQNFLEIFRAKLTAEGYRVETATGGVAGIARAKELKPNLILMDVKMPDMEGTKAAMLLREDEDLKDTKIVFRPALVTEAPTARQSTSNLPKAQILRDISKRRTISTRSSPS